LTPVVIAGFSGGAEGSITGLATCGSEGCYPHYSPCIGTNYANYAEETGSINSTISTTVIITITCADTSCNCGGIDPDTYPYCGLIYCYLDCELVASIDIPTAVGVYTYQVVCNGSTGTASITPI
jgi:hypothetical protein